MKNYPKYTGLQEIAALAFTRKRCITVININADKTVFVSLISGFNTDVSPIYLRYDVQKDHYDLYTARPPLLNLDHERNAYVNLVTEQVDDDRPEFDRELVVVASPVDYLQAYRNVDNVYLRLDDNPCPTIHNELYWDVPGDGNCLFYSLSLSQFKNINKSNIIRENVVNFVRRYWTRLPFAMTLEVDSEESVQMYVNRMGRSGEWGGSLEIMAFCHVYKRRVVIIESYRNLHQRNQNTVGPNDLARVSLLYGYARSTEPIIYLRKTVDHYGVWARQPSRIDMSGLEHTLFDINGEGEFVDTSNLMQPSVSMITEPREELDMSFADNASVLLCYESSTHPDLIHEPYWRVSEGPSCNSLFLALSLATARNLDEASTIRNTVVSFVASNWNILPPSLNQLKDLRKLNLEQYRENMLRLDSPGDEFEIMAFCHCFQRQVAVVEVQPANELLGLKDEYRVSLLYGFARTTESVIYLHKVGFQFSVFARRPVRLAFPRNTFTLFDVDNNQVCGVPSPSLSGYVGELVPETCKQIQNSIYVKIIGNGNCGYAALSKALFFNFNSDRLLQEKAFNFIVSNWDNEHECGIIRQVLRNENNGVFETVGDYRRASIDNDKQCTSAEISAIAHLYDRQIVVIRVLSINEAVVHLNVGYFHDASPIFLRLQENHYDLFESRPTGEQLCLNLNEGVLYTYAPDNNLNMIRERVSPAHSGLAPARNVTRVPPSIVSRIVTSVVPDSDQPIVPEDVENLEDAAAGDRCPEAAQPMEADNFEMEPLSDDEEEELLQERLHIQEPEPGRRRRNTGAPVIPAPPPPSRAERRISSEDHVPKLPPHLVRARPSLRLVNHRLGPFFNSCYFKVNTRFDLIETHSLSKADSECEFCGALYWPTQLNVKTKQSARCCDLGKVKLDRETGPLKPLDLNDPDARTIHNLFTGADPKSTLFHTHIISYNRIFSTVYPSGRFEFLGSTRQSSHVLRINGKISYYTHPYQETVKYMTADGVMREKPNSINHGHIFFLDLDASTVRERITNSTVDGLDEDIVALLERYLRANNRIIQWFKYTAEVYEEERALAQQENREMKEVVLVINPREKNSDMRRIGDLEYRQRIFGPSMVRPVNDYVAAVFTGEVPEYSYDVKFFPRPRNNSENTMPPHVSQRTHDSMMFPLIYLHGEDCWGTRDALRGQVDHLTHLQYARYRIARRADTTILHQGRRLFLQWIINSQVRVEYDRLEMFRLNQVEFRMDTYKSLRDYIARRAHDQNKAVGKVILLPPTFENTTKNKRENFLDFMAILARFGRPTWFVTFTTNAAWEEVKDRCKTDRCDPRFSPDIVNDVFYEKWLAFQSDMVHHHVAGRVLAWFTVFEAQNRLLMHAHNIYIVDERDVPITGEQVDQVVCATIPNSVQNPELYAKVARFYVHGPCNTARGGNLSWPCRSKGDGDKCRFGFPKAFRDSTNIAGRKPLYRRPQEYTISKFRNGSNILVDNRWIVPYNPVMTLRYDCHIDFEYLPQACAVRYITKYCTKGAHTENVHITQKNLASPHSPYFDWDEITAYKEMRTLGAPEAAFRLAGHTLTEKSVGVEKLPVHLEEEHDVLFHPSRLESAVIIKETPLTAYFALMAQNSNKRHLHYPQVVENHMFSKVNRIDVWKPTKVPRRTIGRMCSVEPSVMTMERFYLRMLLSNRAGLTSFADARTVRGTTHPTYHAACIALGLLADDREIFACLEELSGLCSPHHLRRAFGTLLVFQTPKYPLALWVAFADALSADFAFRINHTDRAGAMKLALLEIEILLHDNGVTLDRLNLPDPNNFHIDDTYPDFIPEYGGVGDQVHAAVDVVSNESRADNLNLFADAILVLNLNQEQSAFVDDVFAALSSPQQSLHKRLFFLCAAGGTGKTTVIKHISARCHKEKRPFRAVAYTGVAATLLFDGHTSHRCFGIPLQKEPLHTTTSTLRLQSKEARDLIPIELVIWDEVSMVTAWQLELVSRLLCHLKNNSQPFGGCVVVLSGDLRQLLPVVPNASVAELIESSIVSSTLWNQFHPVSLTVNMRTGPEQLRYSRWTLDIGEGRLIQRTDSSNYYQEIPNTYILRSIDELKQFVFQDFSDMEIRSSLILTPTNVGADCLNREALDMFHPQETERIYFSATCVMKNKRFDSLQNVEDQQYIESLSSGGLPHHKLHLKVGAPVLLMRNLSVQLGLCNGTRLIVVQLHEFSIFCKIASGVFQGCHHYIPRITFYTTAFGLSGTLRRIQYPLKLAFAITINKSQGQTLDGRCGVYLDKPPFAHAMLYVALSRVTSGDNIRIVIENSFLQGKKTSRGGNTKQSDEVWFTQNIVYEEVLRHIPGFLPPSSLPPPP